MEKLIMDLLELLAELHKDIERLDALYQSCSKALEQCIWERKLAVIESRKAGAWPDIPDGEGTGLTASEVEQGCEAPPGCDPKGGEGLCACGHPKAKHWDTFSACFGEGCECECFTESAGGAGAGYHSGSDADPRD